MIKSNTLSLFQLLAGMSGSIGTVSPDAEKLQTDKEDIPFVSLKKLDIMYCTLSIRKVFYLLSQEEAHEVIATGDLRAINNNPVIRKHLNQETIIGIIGQEEKQDRIVYDFISLEIPYNRVMNETKSFKFKGTKAEVLYKRFIMFIYVHSSKEFKEKIIEMFPSDNKVTRKTFTKSLINLSTNVEPLLNSIIRKHIDIGN